MTLSRSCAWMCLFLCLIGCQSSPSGIFESGPLPQSLQKVDQPGEPFLYQVWQMMQAAPLPRYYAPISAESDSLDEVQVVKIDTLANGNWRYTSVYNVFEAGTGELEYAVMQFSLSPADTQRIAVMDARCWMGRDTAYFPDITQRELIIRRKETLTLAGHKYDIYVLDAYAHKGDVEIAHIKYWSPQYGTLCIQLFTGPVLMFKNKHAMHAPLIERLAQAVYEQLLVPNLETE